MKKAVILGFIVIVFILVGCASRSQFAPVAEAPMEMIDAYGGGYDKDVSAERSYAEAEESAAFGNTSTVVNPLERMVIKNANLSIVVQDPLEKMESIAAMADEMGGYVVNSNVWQNTLSSGAKVPHTSISIRVPAERLDEALARIKAGVGEILSENVSGQDVTSDYTDLTSRLRNLEAAETQLQQIMDEATKTEDVLQVYNNLVDVREQIEVIKGQMKYYEQAAAMSMISVDITGDEEAQPLQIGGWKPAGVAKDAIETMVDTLQWLGDVAIWVVLCVLPVGIVVGIPMFFIGRTALRFRKQRKAAKKAEEQLQTNLGTEVEE